MQHDLSNIECDFMVFQTKYACRVMVNELESRIDKPSSNSDRVCYISLDTNILVKGISVSPLLGME